jgi:predicted transcriptional regulator with HTH domain
MIEQLFGSKTRVKLLQLFYSNPNRAFYVREITRKVDEQINSVRRELANLLGIGIINSESNNNRLYYEVNQDYENYKPLSMVFGGAKPKVDKKAKKNKDSEAQAESEAEADVVVEHPLAQSVRGLGRVELAVLTGMFTRDELPGIDILIVGEVNKPKLSRFISDLEKEENRDLRYTVIPLSNYQYRLQINDRFINNILSSKKQVIINNQALPADK